MPRGVTLTDENIHLYETGVSDWEKETVFPSPTQLPKTEYQWDWSVPSRETEEEWSEEDDWPLSLLQQVLQTVDCSVILERMDLNEFTHNEEI